MVFPNLDECEEIYLLICLIAKKTYTYYAKHHNIKPFKKQFITNLRLEADTKFRSARLTNNLNTYYDKWKQLKFLREQDINNILTLARTCYFPILERT